jgi:hypothetical protein
MRYLFTLIIAAGLAIPASALPLTPVVIQDQLASQNSSDVIGDPRLFDIDYLKISSPTGNNLQVEIRFNFGGGTSLNPFTISGFTPALNVGDLFFRTADNTYAYILRSHNGLATNGLYEITGTQSAQTVLGNPSGTYRKSSQVWASSTGAQLLSTGTSNIVALNNRPTNLLATFVIPLSMSLVGELSNGFDVYFAAATCGNDEVFGEVPGSPVPEPGTWAMIGAGFLAIGLLRRNRK